MRRDHVDSSRVLATARHDQQRARRAVEQRARHAAEQHAAERPVGARAADEQVDGARRPRRAASRGRRRRTIRSQSTPVHSSSTARPSSARRLSRRWSSRSPASSSGVISDSRGTPRWATPISRRPRAAPARERRGAAQRLVPVRRCRRTRRRSARARDRGRGSRAARSRPGTARRAGSAPAVVRPSRGRRRRAARVRRRSGRCRRARRRGAARAPPSRRRRRAHATSSLPRSSEPIAARRRAGSLVGAVRRDTASRVSRAPVAQARVWPSSIASVAIASGSMATTMRWVMRRRYARDAGRRIRDLPQRLRGRTADRSRTPRRMTAAPVRATLGSRPRGGEA